MRSIILGILLLTVGVAHAETGMVVGMGIGSKSCGRFIAAIGDLPPGQYNDIGNGHFVSENTQYQQWLMGFMTGFSAARFVDNQEQPIPKRIDLAGMDLWMRNWCNKHPTESVFRGANAFINELRANAAAGR